MQFEPAFLKIAPGDVVHFVAVDKGHDTESLPGGIPEGAEAWKGKISTNIDVTFTVPGLYAYKCTPHLPLGMVGLIQVGDAPANLDAITALKLSGKAKARMGELLALQAAPPAQ
jgi:pseudoazurin